MVTIPAPTHASEEWLDADFDIPEGADITPPPVGDDDEDWDVEMDLGKTGGAKAIPLAQNASIHRSPLGKGTMVSIRPSLSTTSEATSPTEGDDDEGISTIKISALPMTLLKSTEIGTSLDEDMEADFALPSDLTQLSLRPLSLHHRGSKASLEWGDRDHTSSSASSSDAYSSLGFNPSNNSTVISLPDTDVDCNEDGDTDLDGLVIPTGLFESDQGRKHLTKILDLKKKVPKIEEQVNVASPDPEDDFEIGLVINGDEDISPTKFIQTQETKRGAMSSARSNSMPARTATSTSARPPSRLKSDRPKMPGEQFGSMSRATSRISTSPPLLRPTLSRRTQTLQPLPSAQASQAPSSFIAPKQGQSKIRNQKSHGVLKSHSPTTSRKLSRKASLSSLLETSNAQDSSAPESPAPQTGPNYSATTAASRARMHTNSTSRMHTGHVPPTRPSTPADNPAALRLTMPTSLNRIKSRPSISGIFPPSTPPPLPPTPTNIPAQYRPASRTSTSASAPVKPARRLKRRDFGDGTELDEIEDLPTDRDKEAKFRVQPKPPPSRVPSGSSQSSQPKVEEKPAKGTLRRKKDTIENAPRPAASMLSLKHKQSRIEGLSKNENPQKRKPSSSATRRKPTLIRNLGGAGAPKVVGEMRWNPQTLRWEGNDQALRDFDSASARPALITHLTGSSVSGSPGGNFGPTARVVGNMVFDPVRMCWMSTLPPDEEEPDVFADLADDEKDDDWEAKGGTIRATVSLRPSTSTDTGSHSDASRKTPSPIPSVRSRAQSLSQSQQSQSDSDHGSRASLVFDLEDNFIELCRAAEARHRVEMKGWTLGRSDSVSSFAEPDRSCLYEIRTLATRQY
ncbi:uncharacterized protein FOMMEDRAFT_140130 [Fomitiporia mediterranea MF3/22]|uniref:uncharacterized protein n=1 Tax=Fomitiporia mediterranea (strain MF3/22) TaxID=694068 RepID=UPI0004409B68|nr:uncharacterized protein FOMMEDRAFT_140130 [Fomitiporia mediterranea MF3/22]EJD04054.1 hypothetical protein FOMMEDRAFT_140130 [Fomitiporia mediterranea MF3/22]